MEDTALIVSAFCGTGKTFFCECFNNKEFIEVECWKYDKIGFPTNCVSDIRLQLRKARAIFISTNPVVLDALSKMNVNIILIYPSLELKNEYLGRYKKRHSSNDFIATLSKYWDDWLNEIKEHKNCRHIMLKSGQHLSDILWVTENSLEVKDE